MASGISMSKRYDIACRQWRSCRAAVGREPFVLQIRSPTGIRACTDPNLLTVQHLEVERPVLAVEQGAQKGRQQRHGDRDEIQQDELDQSNTPGDR